MRVTRRLEGVTLIELLVALLLLAILATLAFPSVVAMVDKYRLKGAVDHFASDLQFAKMEAVRRNQSVSIHLVTGANWCYGMRAGSACDCTQPTSTEPTYCDVKRVLFSEFPGAALSSQTFAAQPVFDPVQGLSSQAGSVVFQSLQARQGRVDLNLMGMVSVCTPTGVLSAGYAPC